MTPGAGGQGVRIAFSAGGSAHELEGSRLLAAVGRRANTDDLGLDKAGIATDARGFIVVDDELRTNVTGVWALGDANGKGAFPTPRSTITKSSPPTFCTAASAAYRTASPPTRSSSTRRPAGPA